MAVDGSVFRGLCLAAALALTAPQLVRADVSPFSQALAIAAAEDEAVAAWFRTRSYAPYWTGPGQAERRAVLLGALARADDHGLPVSRYDAQRLSDAFRNAETEGDRGRLEVAMPNSVMNPTRLAIEMTGAT